MTTKAKAKKPTPAKQIPKPVAKPGPEKAPELNIKVVRVGSCPSLSDTGVLDYEVGADEAGEVYFRITANNAGGFWSKEWLAWSEIFSACNGQDAITSILLRGLFKGKSVNTAGFLLAALMDQGLIQRKAGKSRCYMLTDAAYKQAPANAT
tara:strand:+ start:10238 stop:10690 length:453 start_codon:yes stop_codon:yes gene_type:complete